MYGDSPDAYVEAKKLFRKLDKEECKPWIDEEDLQFGDVLAEKIFWAIKHSDFIIPIMTAGYATSLWCLRELYYAALQEPKKTIIPMLLEGEGLEVINNQKAGKWLKSMGTVQKYFRTGETAAMIKYLKEKVATLFSLYQACGMYFFSFKSISSPVLPCTFLWHSMQDKNINMK